MTNHPGRALRGPVRIVVVGAAVGMVLGGCAAAQPDDHRSADVETAAATDVATWVADPAWQACADENAVMPDGESIVDTEAEREGQRQLRAYGQCSFERGPEQFDPDDPEYRTSYDLAYGISWGEDEPSGDPLAPWPGKEDLGWGRPARTSHVPLPRACSPSSS
ncbi:MAG TPA: hypothetical protein VGC67_15220 [Cellulomonas sp.]